MDTSYNRLNSILWVATGFGFAVYIMGKLILGKGLPPSIPLWYGRPWGELQLASPNYLIVLPSLMILISILTTVILKKTEVKDTMKFILGWSGIISNLILIMALLRIWGLAL